VCSVRNSFHYIGRVQGRWSLETKVKHRVNGAQSRPVGRAGREKAEEIALLLGHTVAFHHRNRSRTVRKVSPFVGPNMFSS
jgi:hypothetical protein